MNLCFKTCTLSHPERTRFPDDVLSGWKIASECFLPDTAWKAMERCLKRPEVDRLRGPGRWNVVAVRHLTGQPVLLDGVRFDGTPDFFSRLLKQKHPSYYAHCQKALRMAHAWNIFKNLVTTGGDVAYRDEACITKIDGGPSAHDKYPPIRGLADLPDEVRPPENLQLIRDGFGQTDTHFYVLSNIEFRYEDFLDIISSICPRTEEREKALAEYLSVASKVLPALDCQFL